MKNGFMNNIIGLVLVLVIGASLVGGLLAPTISGLTDAQLTIENDGAYFAAPDGENHTIIFKEGMATVDNVDVSYPVGYGTGNAGNATVILGSNWMFRLDSGLLRLVLAGPEQNFVNLGSVENEITVNISGTDLTYTYNNQESTLNNVEYYLAQSGDMKLCYNPYITKDSLIVGGIRNNSNTANADCFEIVKGTIADGFTATNCRSYISAATPTTGDFTSTEIATTETINGDLLKLTNISQNVTFWNDATATFTLTYVLAPATITYDNPAYIGATNAAIMGVVTLLGIVLLVTIAASSVRSKY